MSETMERRLTSPWFDAERIAEWILEKSDPTLGSSQAVTFTLSHVTDDKGLEALTPATVDKKLQGPAREERVQKVVDQFHVLAQTVANCFPRLPSRFVLGAHLKPGPNVPAHEQTMFLVRPDKDATDAYDFSDLQDAAGALANMQRIVTEFSRERRADLDRYREWNREVLDWARESMNAQVRLTRETQEALDASALRKVAVEKMTFELEVQRRALDTLVAAGVPLLNAWIASKTLQLAPSAQAGKPSSGANGAGSAGAGSNGTSSNGASSNGAANGVATAAPAIAAGPIIEPMKVYEIFEKLPREQQEQFLPMLELVFERLPDDKRAELVMLIRAATKPAAPVEVTVVQEREP